MSQLAGFMRHIAQCNRWEPAHFTPLWVGGVWVGNLKPPLVARLLARSDRFELHAERLLMRDEGGGLLSRTQLLDEVVEQLILDGVMPSLQGERYPLAGADRTRPVATIDRAVAPYLGVRAYGQHINGYVMDPQQGMMLWVARRALDRNHYPGKLDNMVAGGLPVGLSLEENLLKECQEEASIAAELAQQARPVGAVSYCCETERGLKPDTLYCYDLQLPADFIPLNSDGEVESFQLLPVAQVAERVAEGSEFKLNCNLVITDFLIRHGHIQPDEGLYGALVSGLHPRLPGD